MILWLLLLVAQTSAVPDAWLGVWKLNLSKSTLDERAPIRIAGQTLTIAVTGSELVITGDTQLPDGRHIPEVSNVKLDGSETAVAPGIVATFKRSGNDGFEIAVAGRTPAGNGVGMNRFVFSPDGKTLTETKTQTVGNQTSTSILIFDLLTIGR